MASNFPANGPDVFVDPGANTLTNNSSQSHHAMHGTANDGLVAVQIYMQQDMVTARINFR